MTIRVNNGGLLDPASFRVGAGRKAVIIRNPDFTTEFATQNFLTLHGNYAILPVTMPGWR